MGETEQNHQLKPQEEKSERWFGFGKQRLLKVFFGGNAVIAVVVLLLITFFLFREGLSFFPQYREDLERYRRSGMEFATMVKEEHERFNELFRSLVDIRKEQIDQLTAAGLSHEEIREATAPLQALVYDFSDLAIPLRDYQLDVRNIAQGTYQLSLTSHEEETVLAKRYASTISSLRETFPAYAEINLKLADGIEAQMEKLPGFESPALQNKVETFRENAIRFIDMLPVYQAKLIAWQPTKHVGLGEAISSFLFGREWIINNDGHSDYGLLPLLTGSLLVTGIAIILAIPLGVGAAIYTNQMAARGKKRRAYGRALAGPRLVAQHPKLRNHGGAVGKLGRACIGAGVIDIYDFETAALQGFTDLVDERTDIAGFVHHRNEHRDLDLRLL